MFANDESPPISVVKLDDRVVAVGSFQKIVCQRNAVSVRRTAFA
jgi:hypothetical protein